MCLAVPLKIVRIDGKTAVGEAAGLSQKLRVDFIPDVQPGDYVMVHAGFAIQINARTSRGKHELHSGGH